MKRYSYALTLPLMAVSLIHAQGKLPPAAEPNSATVPKTEGSSSLFTRADDLRPVFFARSQSDLNPGTMQMLKDNAAWLKRNMPLHILVAGYSDGQGTPEQNLAMGQRRAGALRDFYVAMGIPRSRISTVSYGQEEPVCFELTEECQAQNRRADTLIENKNLAAR